ncbi:response regulator transcription factor [Tissierella pigra]|uniref:Response regulator transcription factor n=1 Tax=Tissierella pigra TaxID=2607614 RepID=A0A6N7Y510_9FIRM|nr:response regulator transcription factor [Tissierella pigra]MBU5426403.1 response regulator transcription factor [Tissierella pigra]MSU03130.1 response regulator transcription factor [Tissierella pigra]
MKDKTISVIIADDHQLIREGIKQILELEGNINVVGQACNGEEAFNMAKELEPDIILLDINMPKLNGIETLKKIKDMGIKTKVVILTIHEDKEYILKTLKLGADAYMLKDLSSDNLIRGIQEVAKGKKYIQSSVADLVKEFSSYEEYPDTNINKINSLTKREYEVLILIAEGLNNKDIAENLYISEKTVKNHVSNIFKKLDINDRVQAAIFAYKNNIKKL